MRNVFVLKLALFSFFVLVLSSGAFALNNCFLADYNIPQPGYQLAGFISMQGHYANAHIPGRVAFPHGLFCDNRLVLNRPDGVATFNFSNPSQFLFTHNGVDVYGSGHVTFTGNGVLFEGEAKHGFTEGKCKVVSGGASCASGDVCVLKVSNQDQGTVADCRDAVDLPYQNDFRNRICCTPTEYCRDGIDNTGDNLIDCASPDCHASSVNPSPQRCDPNPSPGNDQTTEDCVVGHTINPSTGVITPQFSPHCMGPDPTFPGAEMPYYCNYGFDDNSSILPGFCCPQGQWYDSAEDECTDFQICGIESAHYCEHSFPIDESSWFSRLYNGGDKWCHSHLPSFRPTGKSEACCPVMTHGTFGYYILDKNVKIFGYE
jgi:hypothetical protein